MIKEQYINDIYIDNMSFLKNKTILILDDDILHRQYLKDLMQGSMDSTGDIIDVATSKEALNQLERKDPDLCIFDLQLSDSSNGIDVAREVWSQNNNQRILFWSQFADELYVRKLFSIVPEDAIYGFIIKTALDDQILNAIQYILEYDQCWIDPKIRKLKVTTFDKNTGLTDVEYETLVDLTLGLSDNAIANRRFITRRGVQNRLSSLFKKLGVTDEQLSTEEWGYMFSPRTRSVTLALMRGLINSEAIKKENELLQKWIDKVV